MQNRNWLGMYQLRCDKCGEEFSVAIMPEENRFVGELYPSGHRLKTRTRVDPYGMLDPYSPDCEGKLWIIGIGKNENYK